MSSWPFGIAEQFFSLMMSCLTCTHISLGFIFKIRLKLQWKVIKFKFNTLTQHQILRLVYMRRRAHLTIKVLVSASTEFELLKMGACVYKRLYWGKAFSKTLKSWKHDVFVSTVLVYRGKTTKLARHYGGHSLCYRIQFVYNLAAVCKLTRWEFVHIAVNLMEI